MPPVAFRDPFERTPQPPQVIAVIPARYASTRLPGKPLVEIGGRPMIEHVYRRAADARGVDAVVVATDHARIVSAVEAFGGLARLTAAGHRTGTDRIAEVVRDLPCSIVVNVQGDLPLVEPDMIAQVVEPLVADASLPMSTVCAAMTNDDDYGNPNVVKVVRDGLGNALYFSRSPVPYFREKGIAMKHLGLYAYRRDFLLVFASLPQTPLEQAESLEQLRALEHGFRIRVVHTQYESVEVDTPEDLERVRRMLAVAAR